MKMKATMQKYFDLWIDADSGMGKQSCSRGQIFEDKVLTNVMPYIFEKERYKALGHIKED